MIVVLLVLSLLLFGCSRMRTLHSPVELDTKKSYHALINKKVKVHWHNNNMIEGVLSEVRNDSITVISTSPKSSIRIAQQDVNHIDVFEPDNSVLIASAVVVVFVIMFLSVKGLAAGISSAGH